MLESDVTHSLSSSSKTTVPVATTTNVIQNLEFVFEQESKNIVPQYTVKYEPSSSPSSLVTTTTTSLKATASRVKQWLRAMPTFQKRRQTRHDCHRRSQQRYKEMPTVPATCSSDGSNSSSTSSSDNSYRDSRISLTTCCNDNIDQMDDIILQSSSNTTAISLEDDHKMDWNDRTNAGHCTNVLQERDDVTAVAGSIDRLDQLLELSGRYFALGQIYQYKLCLPQQAQQYYYHSYHIAIQCYNKIKETKASSSSSGQNQHQLYTANELKNSSAMLEEIYTQIKDAKECIGRLHFEMGNIEDAMRML